MTLAAPFARPLRAGASNWTVVVLMALGFGLVGVDRFMISTLFPVIAKDLKLGYDDIGTISGALAFAWGISALFMGNLADRLGRRRVLAGALVVFAVLIGMSGLAASLMGLILVRVVMGLADGAYTPASIATTLEAAAPRRRGLAIGVQQMMLPLFGLGLAPLAVSALLHLVDWRWTFVIFAPPGLLLAWAVWRFLPKAPLSDEFRENILAEWSQVLAFRNIRLGMALMLCWLTCLITTSALLPSYLVDHLGLSLAQMGGVISAIGLGSAVGTIVLCWLSDRLGRKPVMILSALGAMACLYGLSQAGPDPAALFGLLFAVHFFNNAGITLTTGPLCTETVPVGLMATASGMVIAAGELIGGGLGPVAAGQIATRFGIGHVLWLPIAALGLAIVLASFLIETRRARDDLP